MEERLANLISDSITPRLVSELQILTVAAYARRRRTGVSRSGATLLLEGRGCGRRRFCAGGLDEQARGPRDDRRAPPFRARGKLR